MERGSPGDSNVQPSPETTADDEDWPAKWPPSQTAHSERNCSFTMGDNQRVPCSMHLCMCVWGECKAPLARSPKSFFEAERGLYRTRPKWSEGLNPSVQAAWHHRSPQPWALNGHSVHWSRRERCSNSSEPQDYLEGSFTHRWLAPPPEGPTQEVWGEIWNLISTSFPSHADTTDAETTLGEPLA